MACCPAANANEPVHMITRRSLIAALGVAPLAAVQPGLAIRGIYSSPLPFWNKGARLNDFDVNAVFVGAGSITPALMERAAAEGARVYAEFPTLNGKGYVEKHPEAWPLNERGEKAPAATWFMGVCPTDPAFRAFRRKQLEDLLDRHDVAGVWMDYLHWHAQFEDPHPILPETCFNQSCLSAFAAWSGIRLPSGGAEEQARFVLKRHDRRWREWRTVVLADWVRDFRAVLKLKRPQALLGAFHCPWTDREFGGARRRTLGLDLRQLASLVDVLSPMVYHGRMGRRPEWVGEYVAWLANQTRSRCRIWPIVQAQNEPRPVTAAEFEKVLRLGAGGGASGVMMFTAQAVAADAAKMEAMRRVYRELRGGG